LCVINFPFSFNTTTILFGAKTERSKQRTFLPLPSIHVVIKYVNTLFRAVPKFDDFLTVVDPQIEVLKVYRLNTVKTVLEHKSKILLTEAARLQLTSRSNKAVVTRELAIP